MSENNLILRFTYRNLRLFLHKFQIKKGRIQLWEGFKIKVKACPDCVDAHAKRVVKLYKNLNSPLNKIRKTEDQNEAKKVLEKWLRDAVALGFSKKHGPLNIEIEDDTLHILDENGKKLC